MGEGRGEWLSRTMHAARRRAAEAKGYVYTHTKEKNTRHAVIKGHYWA
jgi:hypothetical protein